MSIPVFRRRSNPLGAVSVRVAVGVVRMVGASHDVTLRPSSGAIVRGQGFTFLVTGPCEFVSPLIDTAILRGRSRKTANKWRLDNSRDVFSYRSFSFHRSLVVLGESCTPGCASARPLVSFISRERVTGFPLFRARSMIDLLSFFMVVWLRLISLFSFSAFSHFRGKP